MSPSAQQAAPVLYLDCSSGISGDMVVGALLDLGADRGALDAALASLPLDGYTVAVTLVSKNGLAACDFDVRLDAAHENHDHDMAWLFGHEHDGGGHHGHGHGDEHAHGAHGHDGHEGHHEHRTLADVLAVVDAGSLTDGARALAHRVFEILADAEATAHGTTRDLVHFHEVGAVDSIADVVAAAVCLDSLDVRDVVVGDLAEGCGTIRCAHGILPVPVPAVVAVASRFGLPLRATRVRGELVTPTGAALAAALRTRDALPERYRILRAGYGAGKRPYEGCSGTLRALLIEELPARDDAATPGVGSPAGTSEPGASSAHDAIVKLECDLDDCTGELLGRLVGLLLEAGAREAHYLPVFTKKNRPAWQLQVICTEADRPALERLVFEESTTIGIRRCAMERTVLPRRTAVADTPLGPMAYKEVVLPGGATRGYPEYESVVEAACAVGVPLPDAYRACLAACKTHAAGRGKRA